MATIVAGQMIGQSALIVRRWVVPREYGMVWVMDWTLAAPLAGIAVVSMERDLDRKRVGMSDVEKVVVAVALMAMKLAVLTATCSVGK